MLVNLGDDMRVKVKVFPCTFNYCATVYSDDKSKIIEAVDNVKKELMKVFPLADDVYIEFSVLGFSVNEDLIKKSVVGFTDALVFKCKTLDEFVETIKKILDKKRVEYDVEIEEYR